MACSEPCGADLDDLKVKQKPHCKAADLSKPCLGQALWLRGESKLSAYTGTSPCTIQHTCEQQLTWIHQEYQGLWQVLWCTRGTGFKL